MQQAIRYLTTGDGARLAWASLGSGPVLVKAANWLSHLEYDWKARSGATGTGSSASTTACSATTNAAAA